MQEQAPALQKRYGALRELEAVTAPGETISAIEITDHASGHIAGIWKKFRDEKLSGVEVYILKTNERRKKKEIETIASFLFLLSCEPQVNKINK